MLSIILTILLTIFTFKYLQTIIKSWKALNHHASKSSMIRPLTLRQYLFYYFTLKIDYTLIAAFRLLIHEPRKLFFKWGLVNERLSHEEQLGGLFLDTSLMLYFQADSLFSETKTAKFYAKEFSVPHMYYQEGSMVLNDFEVTVDLLNRRALSAKLGNRDLSIHEGLRLAGWLLTANSHVNVHDIAARAAETTHPRPEVRKSGVYTFAINNAAIAGATPFTYTRNEQNQLNMFNAAISRSFPKHSHMHLTQLVPYSKTAGFLIKARKVCIDILSKHKLNLDFEGFFLQTVMHATDHFSAAETSDPISMIGKKEDDQKLCADSDYIFALFVEDIGSIFVDTKLKNSSVPWHKEMFEKLNAIDPKYAEKIDWCIAY